MNEMRVMQAWVQGSLDAYTVGTVHLEICDGVPGNWTLYYLGTQEVKRSQALHGAALVRYRCHYRLKTIADAIDPACALQAYLLKRQEAGGGPGLSDLPGGQLTVENLHRTKSNKDGTGEYEMEIYGEYDRYYPGEA